MPTLKDIFFIPGIVLFVRGLWAPATALTGGCWQYGSLGLRCGAAIILSELYMRGTSQPYELT